MAKNKKSSTIGSALRRMFGLQKKQLSFQEEEALQSPGKVSYGGVRPSGLHRDFPVCDDWPHLHAH